MFKFIEIHGIPIKIIKIDGKWYYKHHFCECYKNCKNRIPYKKYHSWHGIPKVIVGHITDEAFKKIDKTHTGMFGKYHSEESIEKMCESQNKRFQDPKEREKLIKAMSGKNNPMFGKHRILSKETIEKIRKGNTGKYVSKKTCRKMSVSHSGENHYNWQGGISFEPYCHRFNNRLKRAVRKRDHYTCQRCGKRQKEENRVLCVHHIHFDKENCYPDLITLCHRCNVQVNYRRKGSEKRFMKNLKERNLLNWCP